MHALLFCRFDHESRLVPYLLTGLFDQNDDIKLLVFEKIEEIGELYEIEHVKSVV